MGHRVGRTRDLTDTEATFISQDRTSRGQMWAKSRNVGVRTTAEFVSNQGQVGLEQLSGQPPIASRMKTNNEHGNLDKSSFGRLKAMLSKATKHLSGRITSNKTNNCTTISSESPVDINRDGIGRRWTPGSFYHHRGTMGANRLERGSQKNLIEEVWHRLKSC
ncbi:hypothetical protein V6N11_046565 [Hibiscus sabdariffa]|uniref:Uncharacterized protein n=2 Tax=Hibiscus sabdariffa TaxID=183260 RepID=A0ABR2BVT6_9ROSI